MTSLSLRGRVSDRGNPPVAGMAFVPFYAKVSLIERHGLPDERAMTELQGMP